MDDGTTRGGEKYLKLLEFVISGFHKDCYTGVFVIVAIFLNNMLCIEWNLPFRDIKSTERILSVNIFLAITSPELRPSTSVVPTIFRSLHRLSHTVRNCETIYRACKQSSRIIWIRLLRNLLNCS